MKYLYRSFLIFTLVITLPFLNCADEEDELPKTPIFNDVELIETDEDNDYFYFALPSKVAYAVLGVFDDEIETEGNVITNEEDFEGGSRTGLAGWTRSRVAKTALYEYSESKNDFTDDPYNPLSGHEWAVWGYDKWGNLTHASGPDDVN